MKRHRLAVPIILSLLSGLIVSTQVYFARIHDEPKDRRRVLIALRNLPSGHLLHPRDFTLQWVGGLYRVDVIDAESSHGLWGQPLKMALPAGEVLTHGAIVAIERSSQKETKPKRVKPIEIIQESGE